MSIKTALLGFDVALLGIVFALVLFILVFSAIVLYIAFRIKETFREEKRRGMVIAKVSFLVGVLFLAAGGFYFLTQAISPGSPSDGGAARLTLSISYPTQVRRNSAFNMSFTVTNPTASVAHDAVLQTNVLLQQFIVLSSSHPVTGNVVRIGNVSTGTVVVALVLGAPDVPGSVTDTITLVFTEATAPPTQVISIRVSGGP